MGRPIDSQELRNAMYHEAFETDSDEQRWDGGCWIRYKMFERILDSLPSAQPEPRWIPCEERLPENGHYYLWCSDMGSVQSDYYWNGFENGMKYGYNIVAWMPLPRAYKEDSDG